MARVQRAPNGKYYDVETKREVTKDGKPISIVNSNQKSTSVANSTKKPLALDIAKGVTALQQAAAKGINSPESKSYMTLTNNKIKTEKPKPLDILKDMTKGEKVKKIEQYVENKRSESKKAQSAKDEETIKNLTSGLSVPKGITSVQTPVDKLKESQIKAQETTKNLTSGLSVPKGITSVQTPSDRLKDSQIKAQDKKVVSEVKPKIEVKKEEEVKPVSDNQITPADTPTLTETPSSKAYSDLIEAQKAKTISDLDAIKQQALGKIGQQQAAINPQFEAQRAQAATQSMQQARNFAEYMAARGQTNAGITAQAELSRGSGLTRQLGEIGQQQQATQQDVAMRRSVIEQDYLNKIANATTEAEIQKAAKEYQDLIKQEERTYQESRQTLQREQELADIASSREFAKQQSAEQRQFAREQQQAGQQAGQQAEKNKQEQQQVEQQQDSFANSAIDLVRQSKIQVPARPEIRNPFNGFILSEAVPEQFKTVSPSEILDNIIQNAEEMRSTYGDKNYERILKEARLMANKQLAVQQFNQ